MATPANDAALPSHPSSHRHRISLTGLLLGLFGGPLVWAIQFNVNYALTSHVCFPYYASLVQAPARWSGVHTTLFIVNGLALLLVLAAAVISWRDWRETHGEHVSGTTQLLDAGEGRTRFMSICGLMTSIGFFLAIAFNTYSLFVVPPCVD